MNLLMGVTGSSGVLELPLYLRILKEKLGADIKIVATPSVENFVSLDFLSTYVDRELYVDFLSAKSNVNVPHSDLSAWADMFVVLPCTANTLAKAAHGDTDNLLTMLLLCYPEPVIFFPNMNPNMWSKKVVQRNVKLLLSDGHKVVSPSGNGWITATGDAVLSGHMPPPYAIADYIKKVYEDTFTPKKEVMNDGIEG
ncbi:flavoprotein [Guptibacillus sedimenti]|uniref:flavoprotein n=1 Tax=Guptibacillus sedimenti TaxID=3025680 RepID=UPI00236060CC|nr:flavoprotein [Pseudalkalibacillus sedimenti]